MVPEVQLGAAAILEPVFAETAAGIVAASSGCIDETSWSEAKGKACFWVGLTDDLTATRVASDRGTDEGRSIAWTDPG